MSRFYAIFCCLCVLAMAPLPVMAQVINSPDAPGNPTPISDEPKSNTLYTGITGDKPYVISADIPPNLDVIARGEASMAAYKASVEADLNRKAEEATYYQRGVALDFLNKPIKLFELTCTTTGGISGQLPEAFKFAVQQWSDFCKDVKGVKGKVKCAAKTIMKTALKGANDKLKEFKDQGFCRTFTDFVNNQVSQCITVRFNLPRGQFPGFSALNQCMFGRLGMSVDSKGQVTADGQIMADVVSAHAFQYSSINANFSPFGFGGKEEQLLGEDGVSGLMDPNKWKSTKGAAVAGSSCGALDPDLVAAFTNYPNRGDGKPENSGTYLNPTNNEVRGWKPDPSATGGADWQTLALWAEQPNSVTQKKDIVFVPASGSSVSWSPKAGYTYLASCYGFEMYPLAALCGTPGTSKAWNEQYCKDLPAEDFCCDPDATDCIGQKIFLEADRCINGKSVTDANGNTVCSEGIERKAGDVSICAGTCCNPAKNDCTAINVPMCDKYKGVTQCVAATPAQLAEFDPVYSKLRAKPNMSIDGKMCCVTEWCNLCPQDLIATAANMLPGATVYLKNSELANVPAYCKAPRSNGGNKYNDNPSGYLLTGVADQVFENTQEACTLMQTQGWDAAKVKKVFIDCPQKEKTGGFLSKLLDPLSIGGKVTDIIVQVATDSNGCPDGGEVKPYINEVVVFGICGSLGEVTRFPAPITKIVNVEGQDAIGLCSELNLCPASIPAGENPNSNTQGSTHTYEEDDAYHNTQTNATTPAVTNATTEEKTTVTPTTAPTTTPKKNDGSTCYDYLGVPEPCATN